MSDFPFQSYIHGCSQSIFGAFDIEAEGEDIIQTWKRGRVVFFQSCEWGYDVRNR